VLTAYAVFSYVLLAVLIKCDDVYNNHLHCIDDCRWQTSMNSVRNEIILLNCYELQILCYSTLYSCPCYLTLRHWPLTLNLVYVYLFWSSYIFVLLYHGATKCRFSVPLLDNQCCHGNRVVPYQLWVGTHVNTQVWSRYNHRIRRYGTFCGRMTFDLLTLKSRHVMQLPWSTAELSVTWIMTYRSVVTRLQFCIDRQCRITFFTICC